MHGFARRDSVGEGREREVEFSDSEKSKHHLTASRYVTIRNNIKHSREGASRGLARFKK